MLLHAPAILGQNPQLEDGLKLLNDAEAALRTPRHTLSALAANRADETYELPEQHRFPGYDPASIPIRPSEKQFETAADAAAWAATAVAACGVSARTPKPNLPLPAATAEYPLLARNGLTTVALFSDWGTGYSTTPGTSRATSFTSGSPRPCTWGTCTHRHRPAIRRAVHAGPGSVIKAMPLYAMNANHEMDSHGIPYLEFLELKRRRGEESGFTPQPQETELLLSGQQRVPVIGIDTAFTATAVVRTTASGSGCVNAWRVDGMRGS